MDLGGGGGGGGAVFLLSVSGQLSSGSFPNGADDIYCKICFVAGPDWAVTAGQEEAITQIARRPMDARKTIVWNFPFDVTFRSTCPFGWPQIVVSAYSIDSFGNESVCGYGCVHVPLSAGLHAAKVPLFVPESSSLLQRLAGMMMGSKPEFVDARVVANGEGRDVTRVTSSGWVNVQFNIISKDLKRLGYNTAPKGPGSEIKNQGPTEGLGLVSKISTSRGPQSTVETTIPEEDEENESERNYGSIDKRSRVVEV